MKKSEKQNSSGIMYAVFTKNIFFQSYSVQCSHQIPDEDSNCEVHKNLGNASS